MSSRDRKSINNVFTSGASRGVSTYGAPLLPKPELMTDKQILKRLNKELKKSKIFSSVNFSKLPETIKRKEGDTMANIKIKQKKPGKKINEIHNEEKKEEDFSDSSGHEKDEQIEDFYIDKKIDNNNHIDKAKKAASHKVIDHVEWSG